MRWGWNAAVPCGTSGVTVQVVTTGITPPLAPAERCAGSRDGAASPRRAASHAAVRYCQDVALLLLQRRHHRHQAFDKAGAGCTLRAKAALAPEHTGTDRPLCRIVGRLDTGDLHECPQGLTPLQNVPACPFGLRPHRSDCPLPRAARLPGAAASCKSETLSVARCPSRTRCHHVNIWCACASKASPIFSEAPTTVSHRFEIPQQMRPAQLAPPHRVPVVRHCSDP